MENLQYLASYKLAVAHYCMLEWGEVFCFPKGNPVRSDSHLNDLLSKL